jgi:hypothetical protein
MAADENGTKAEQAVQGLGSSAALKAVGAAAATGAATFALQRALSHRSKSDSEGDGEGNGQGGSSVLASAAAGSWEAARDSLVPLAEDAAGAAGRYVAEHGPDFLADRLVPRFITAFNDAKG